MNTSLVSTITAVGHAVPERIVTNHDLEKLMETSDEWIQERSGIKERRFVVEGTTTLDLAEQAARSLFQNSKEDLSSIDMIIASTLSPDLYFPGIGTMLQDRLGLSPIPALDIRQQCSGFVYGIATADAFIRSGQAKRILLVCSEVQSPALNLTTAGRDMAVLFGDGAGAVLIDSAEGKNEWQSKIIASDLGGDGSGARTLMLESPGTATPGFISEKDITEHRTNPQMDGRAVFRNAVTRLIKLGKDMIEKYDLDKDELLVFPHQANLRINEAVREKLGLRPEQVVNNIQRYGNTTSATIPLALSEAEKDGRLKSGQLVMTLAFGAGFTWGANLIRW